MARNNLEDLNDMLFNQLVRLDDDDISGDQLDKEIKRSSAMSKLAKNITDNAQVTISAYRAQQEFDGRKDIEMPRMLTIEHKENNHVSDKK